MQTPIKYFKEPDGALLAVFTETDLKCLDTNVLLDCYSDHERQHSRCSVGYLLKKCTVAERPADLNVLKSTLRGIGYTIL